MITYSIIKKSQLESAQRLDAEYYQPEYLELVKNLENLKAVPIREVVINPKRKFKPVKGEKFKYIEISKINLENGEYNTTDISGENTPDRAQWVLKKYDVIVSMVRPIRNAVSLIDEERNLVCSSGFAVLKSEKVEPEYLFVYLKSKPIIKLLDRLTTASMYPAVTIEDILDTKIYLGDKNFRENVKVKVLELKNELSKSKEFYSQAENLLLEELGLKDFNEKAGLWSIVNLSETRRARRIDAEYFQPKYEILESRIKKYSHKLLDDVLKNVSAKFDPTKQPDQLFKYVELSNINASIGLIDGFSEMLGKETPSRAKRILKNGDVLVSSVEGSLEKVALVHKEQENFLASTGFFQFRSKEILPEVLLILAKSIIFSWQLEKRCAGTILTAVLKESIKDILVPILSKPIQQKISELVQKSHESRKKAKELLEEAKIKVEELIENNQK